MGNFFYKLMDSLSGASQKRIVILGLDAAGKTTILYKLNLGDVVHTIPTVGFNVETIKYKNIEMTCWDIGGQKKIRGLWYHYYHETDAVIFVVDSCDPDRIAEAKEELDAILGNDILRDACILVYANKQDLPHAMAPATMMDKLGLSSQYRNRQWHVQGTVATSGSGLYEGLDWLSTVLKDTPKKSASSINSY